MQVKENEEEEEKKKREEKESLGLLTRRNVIRSESNP